MKIPASSPYSTIHILAGQISNPTPIGITGIGCEPRELKADALINIAQREPSYSIHFRTMYARNANHPAEGPSLAPLLHTLGQSNHKSLVIDFEDSLHAEAPARPPLWGVLIGRMQTVIEGIIEYVNSTHVESALFMPNEIAIAMGFETYSVLWGKGWSRQLKMNMPKKLLPPLKEHLLSILITTQYAKESLPQAHAGTEKSPPSAAAIKACEARISNIQDEISLVEEAERVREIIEE